MLKVKESIFPFVCFGDGCDFDEKSAIIDRVVTIAMFGLLKQRLLFSKYGKASFAVKV